MSSGSGITDLAELLVKVSPKLHENEFVFIVLPKTSDSREFDLQPIASFREPEGLSLVVERSRAEAFGFSFDGVFRMISLQVHSSLRAVGLTAAVSTRLAKWGIPANVVAAYHHDHIFVPRSQADEALRLLQNLA